MSAERWVAVPEHNGYQVSDLGRVRSVDRVIVEKTGKSYRRRGQILRPMRLGAGYLQVNLGAGRDTRRYVHRLVLAAFVGPCSPGMEGCHKNCDPADNRLANLRWDRPFGNAADTLRLGRKREQRKTHCPADHSLSVPNLVNSELPNRKCKACNRARAWVQRGGDPEQFRQVADSYFTEIMEATA